ncbi:calcium-binding protein, partial [Proteus mirabilis]|uniref:calcium-binding protein n=1 Tax=Proteus mirabilis TaxID=584 RepID=UPI0019549E23
DWLRGGSGNDTYIFGIGSGVDRIDEEGLSSSGADRILFKPGLTEADVTFGRSGNDLVVTINGTSDQLTIVDGIWSLINDPGIAWDRVE